MGKQVRVVASFGPLDLGHHSVGCSRYWFIQHRPTGKFAFNFDGAPCNSKVADVKAKFLAMTSTWPSLDDWNPDEATPEEIKRVRSLSTMLERTSATNYRVAP
jgi:hypothetical protein